MRNWRLGSEGGTMPGIGMVVRQVEVSSHSAHHPVGTLSSPIPPSSTNERLLQTCLKMSSLMFWKAVSPAL